MRYNQLEVLTTDLCELPRLRILLVDSNPIEVPPPAVARRGFHAIITYLHAAHRLGPLREEHLKHLQVMCESAFERLFGACL